MTNIANIIIDTVDAFVAWASSAIRQTTESYCELQTADSPTVLVANDGSLVSVLRIDGVKALIGTEEFNNIQNGLMHSLQTSLSRAGHAAQVYFSYNRDEVGEEISHIFEAARETAKRLTLALDDLFNERINYLAKYCAREEVYVVLWTRPAIMTQEQFKRALKDKQKMIKQKNIPPFKHTQNLMAAIPDIRDVHDSFVRSLRNDMNSLGIITNVLEVHEAIYEMRRCIDPDFTDRSWRPSLPGDKIVIKEPKNVVGDVSDILWPSLACQLIPRDAENMDLRTVRIGDRIYSCVFVDLFPKDLQHFGNLLLHILPMRIPWRISFLIEGGGLASLKLKSALTSVLSWTSAQNRLINDSVNLLKYIDLHTDDAVVKLRVAACTWAPEGDIRLLRTRASQLAKVLEGWGSCDVSEVSGDAFQGVVSTAMGISCSSIATASVAPLSHVLYMLPFFRPSSPWRRGATLFRSPDGKPWPYQPGSSEQTTWIDLFYARPGSGKSVLSNSINLALCLAGDIQRLPRISIIDIGPSSSGLISLIKEALPYDKRHLVAYHRMRMTADFSINPFDTQLGCRYPTPQERSFLINFVTLLATPIGTDKPYDGITDMTGLVVDEMYKRAADDGNPDVYVIGVEDTIDGILVEIGFVKDVHTTWWEVTDALFLAGFIHEAMLAQHHASPLLAEAAAICRTPAVEDLYGKITAPTGESLINAFSRMISAAVREYPILSQPSNFDLGEARVISFDLDEVAKSGGDAANRQTAVMYMLARYILARHFYLTEENVADMPASYKIYHEKRIAEMQEDSKRIVFDEFHRTAKTAAIREQVIVDMREGRKWKVQVALISQSIDDFDPVMIEFATSIFIMDAGPEQAIRHTSKTFGLSQTAQYALRSQVHGPREGGSTFLAQFATKDGNNTQLLTSTLGPIELWAFNTTAEDSNVRNQLYRKIGPTEARRVLANVFPSGTVTKYLENSLNNIKEKGGLVDNNIKLGVIENLVKTLLEEYAKNPDFKRLP
ncbi:MAG: type IV secretion protein IcmB [Coxiellaceae bacterium]|jgi:intracellular multiplication protein IcmB|nr:type IV secretion protein IcmB [Coxiellaceae bacterium]